MQLAQKAHWETSGKVDAESSSRGKGEKQRPWKTARGVPAKQRITRKGKPSNGPKKRLGESKQEGLTSEKRPRKKKKQKGPMASQREDAKQNLITGKESEGGSSNHLRLHKACRKGKRSRQKV